MKRLFFIFALACSWAGSASAQGVAVAPLQLPRSQFLSATGIPLASGCVNFFATGTSTPQAIYADSGGVNQLANPLTLDAAGEASVWLSNTGYDIVANTGVVGTACSVSLGAQLWREVNKNPFAIINSGSNYIVASGTSDPSGSVGMLGYRSDIPCFRGFSTIWDCFVTQNGIQALTNKTLTSPTINTPAITSPTITTPVLNGASTGTGVQGTDSKLLTASTVAGTAVPLCTDAQGGATTVGCSAPQGAAAGCTSIGPVTITNNNALQNLLSCSIPLNTLSAGSVLAVDVTGIESTAANQTITISTSLGGGTVCSSVSGGAVAGNNQPWNFVAKFSVLTAGAGGTANWSCEYFGSPSGGGVQGPNGVVGTPTISVNTTVSNTLLITVQMSVANAGNITTAQLLKSVIF